MILTCPDCATSYFVDDSRIPAAGRTVKCSNCGAHWTATREAPPAAAAPEPAPQAPPEPEPEPESVAEQPAAAAASPADDLDIVAAEPEPEPEPAWEAARFPRASAAPAPRRGGRAAAFAWAAGAVAVAAVVASAVLFRTQIVRLWPTSQAAYARFGLPVENLGLVIEAVRVEPTFQGGRPVLSLTGSIRNLKDRAVTAPPLRINLLNREGKPIAAKLARPLDAQIPPRAQRYFAIAIADPPANAHDLEVRFEDGGAQRAAAVGVALPPQAGPPAEAQPLPPGTPESLTEHG